MGIVIIKINSGIWVYGMINKDMNFLMKFVLLKATLTNLISAPKAANNKDNNAIFK